MADVIKTIGTGPGRDYSTITAWEAAIDNTTYPVADTVAVGHVYNDSVYDESVTINAIASNVTGITLTVPEGERHDGTAGTGVRIVASANRNMITDTTVPAVLEWVEMDGNGSFLVTTDHRGTNAVLRNFIIHDSYGSGGGNNISFLTSFVTNSNWSILNTIGYNAGNSGTNTSLVHTQGNTNSTITVCNCTAFNYLTRGYHRQSGIVVLQNCISVNAGGDDFDVSHVTSTLSNNLSSDATASGTGSLTNVSAADLFVSTVEGSEDLHLKAGADAIGAGTNLGTTPTGVNIDIDGYDRDAAGVAWDIGADQYVATYRPYRSQQIVGGGLI